MNHRIICQIQFLGNPQFYLRDAHSNQSSLCKSRWKVHVYTGVLLWSSDASTSQEEIPLQLKDKDLEFCPTGVSFMFLGSNNPMYHLSCGV